MAGERNDGYAAMLEALVTRDAVDYSQLVALSGMSRDTVTAWLKPMRARKLVVIAAWGADSRGYMTTPKFCWRLNGTDATRSPVPPVERVRALRKRRGDPLLTVGA